jgi:hypothetical protein
LDVGNIIEFLRHNWLTALILVGLASAQIIYRRSRR